VERRGVCPLQQHPASPRRHLEAGGRVQSARQVAVAEKGDVKGVASCVLLARVRVDAKRLVPTHSCRCEETLLTPPRGNGSHLFTRATAGAVHPARWRGVCGHHRRLAPAPLPVGEACLASIKEAVGVERRLRPPPRRGLEVGLVGAVDVAVVQPEERVEARGGDLLAR